MVVEDLTHEDLLPDLVQTVEQLGEPVLRGQGVTVGRHGGDLQQLPLVPQGHLAPKQLLHSKGACVIQQPKQEQRHPGQVVFPSPGMSEQLKDAEAIQHLEIPEPLREAEISLTKFFAQNDGNPEAFIYITVTAPDGSYAVTRPYYLKDLL